MAATLPLLANQFPLSGKDRVSNAGPHDLTIAPATGGTTVSLQGTDQIADTGHRYFYSASGNIAWLDLNGYSETIGGIKDSTTFGVVELYLHGSGQQQRLDVEYQLRLFVQWQRPQSIEQSGIRGHFIAG